MNQPTPNAQPSPERIFTTLTAYQQAAALKAAIDLDLFSAISQGNNTAVTAAQKIKAAERGTRILCDYLTVLGFLTKSGGSYGLAPESAVFLDRNSPAYMGTAARFLNAQPIMAAYNDIAAAVRKGGTVVSTDGTLAPDDPVWIEFARGMAPMMVPAAEGIAQLLKPNLEDRSAKVLDVAAGHGMFGITLARHNPKLQAVAVDWAGVLAVARENAQKFGVADRYKALPGSAFDVDYGTGYDAVLFTNFLHHFDHEENVKLLKKAHTALNAGGACLTLEFVPEPDRISPPTPAMFSMIMLASTPKGDAYTFSELEAMYRDAGFRKCTLHPLHPLPQSVVLAHK